jgi:hypothetical protein
MNAFAETVLADNFPAFPTVKQAFRACLNPEVDHIDISGEIGSGKTYLANLLAAHCYYELLQQPDSGTPWYLASIRPFPLRDDKEYWHRHYPALFADKPPHISFIETDCADTLRGRNLAHLIVEPSYRNNADDALRIGRTRLLSRTQGMGAARSIRIYEPTMEPVDFKITREGTALDVCLPFPGAR